MEDTANGERICQQPGDLPHISIIIDCLELPGIQEGIPVRHVHHSFLHLWSSIFEFGEEPPRPQIVIVFVDLTQSIADLQMRLIVFCPVFFATIYGHSAIRTLKMYMSWSLISGAGRLVDIIRCCGDTGRAMVGMRTLGMLSHESCSVPYLRNRRISV